MAPGARSRPKLDIIANKRRLVEAVSRRGDPNRYLQRRRVKPRTNAIYETAAHEFEEFARIRKLAWSTQPLRDETMNAYIHFLFRAGEPASAARMALYGLVHRECLTLKDPNEMQIARAALRGFGVAAPTKQRDPMPWEAVVLLATYLAQLQDPLALDVGRALVVAFDGYLRPSEVVGIKGCDVTIVGRNSVLEYRPVSVTIAPFKADDGGLPNPPTKSGEYDDSVVFGDQASMRSGRGWICGLLAALKKRRPGARAIFTCDLGQLESLTKFAVKTLGMEALRLTPHCARHGGASSDYATSVRPLDGVRRRGRWKAEESVRRYEKAGRLHKQVALISPALLTGIKTKARALPGLLQVGEVVVEKIRRPASKLS